LYSGRPALPRRVFYCQLTGKLFIRCFLISADLLERLSNLRQSVRVMLEIADSNSESGEAEGGESSLKAKEKGKGKGKRAADEEVEDWSDRVKGILYELVDAIAERI
jgi:hypothetical protein